MKCKHYKGDGYTYNLQNKENISLCNECEMYLFGAMAEQAILENKAQKDINNLFLKDINHIQQKS